MFPRTQPVLAVKSVPCVLDRHFGPFEPLPELKGWLGTDWYNCRACRSTLTHHTLLLQKSAA